MSEQVVPLVVPTQYFLTLRKSADPVWIFVLYKEIIIFLMHIHILRTYCFETIRINGSDIFLLMLQNVMHLTARWHHCSMMLFVCGQKLEVRSSCRLLTPKFFRIRIK